MKNNKIHRCYLQKYIAASQSYSNPHSQSHHGRWVLRGTPSWSTQDYKLGFISFAPLFSYLPRHLLVQSKLSSSPLSTTHATSPSSLSAFPYKPSWTLGLIVSNNPNNFEFQMRVLKWSGLGKETCWHLAIYYIPLNPTMEAARGEAELVIFSAGIMCPTKQVLSWERYLYQQWWSTNISSEVTL